MPTFTYEATNQKGEIIKGEASGANEKEVASYLAEKNLIPISIKPFIKRRGALRREFTLPLFGGLTDLDKIEFASRLSSLLKAGIPLRRSLDILVAGTEKPNLKKFLWHLKEDLVRGQPMHMALKRYKKSFSPVFIGLIAAGESSGNLDVILEELAKNLKRDYELKGKVISASVYPSLIFGFGILVVVFLLMFVVPKIVSSYGTAGIKLPAITVAFISIATFLKHYSLWVLIGFIALIFLILLFKKTPKGKMFFARLVVNLPLTGEITKKLILARFIRTFSMLLKSGIVLVEALKTSGGAVENELYKKMILDAQQMTARGVSLADSLANYPRYFPPFLTGTLKAGEESGNLDQMSHTVAEFYTNQVNRSLESLTSILGPVLLLGLGLLIAFVAISIIMPIYNFVGKF